MSAFIVSDKHINAILEYKRQDPLEKYLYANGNELNIHNPDHITLAAQILLYENYRSINTLYGENEAPHKIVWTPTGLKLSPVEALKLCQCYLYQIGENEDYRSSAAAQIIDQIMATAITNLPGYNDAKWAIGD